MKFLQEELLLEESEVHHWQEEGIISTNSPFDMTGLNKLLNLVTNSRKEITNYKILHKKEENYITHNSQVHLLSTVVYTDAKLRLLYRYTHM